MHDLLAPHRHDPNPDPPSADPAFTLTRPDGIEYDVTPSALSALPQTSVSDCYIVSTGHGISGPFTFTGVLLIDLLAAYLDEDLAWDRVEVISGDGFGTRLTSDELRQPGRAGKILLACVIDGEPMTRTQGLVRLIVPSETDDALRQVKWVSQIRVKREA